MDLKTTHPSLVAEWHPTKNNGVMPDQVSTYSHQRIWGVCSTCSHEWISTVSNRSKGRGCPECGKGKTSRARSTPKVGEDLLSVFPDIAKEWHPTKNDLLKPSDVAPMSNKKVWWLCTQCTFEWFAVVASRSNGTGCPECKKGKISRALSMPKAGEDLLSVFPDIAKEWHPTKNDLLKPSEVNVFAKKKVWWQCSQSHEWQAVISSRSNGRGCPYCAGRIAIPGETDLLTMNPGLASEWHPTKNQSENPSNVKAWSHKAFWWICEQGHEWSATGSNRSNGHGCPYCTGQKPILGVNDLKTVAPSLVDEWHPLLNGKLSIDDVTGGSNRNIWWLCSRGHEWKATVVNRFKVNTSCPYCGGRIAIPGETDLATVNPEVAAQWHPTKNKNRTPQQFTRGSNTKVWWLCSQGHEWKAPPNARNSGNGCPSCAKSGFRPADPGWIYFLHHEAWAMFQIGITNVPKDRLNSHKRLGWTTVEVRGPFDGNWCRDTEQELIKELKRRGARFGKISDLKAVKFDGHTEAWTSESLEVESFEQILRWLGDFEWADQ
jgi:hypothetical protein